MRLKDKIAVITGAGTGMGRACAIAFAREGARVALVARRRHLLERVACECGANALVVAADISHTSGAERIVRDTVHHFGGLNVLVNCAAVLIAGTAESLTEEQWDETFNTNVRALWLLSRAVLPEMRRAGGGSIINFSSVAGVMSARNRAAYSASKGAVTLLTKAMALDHGHENIRVNCIAPGIVETELVADFVRKAPDPVKARREREALHALGRFGKPDEVAGCAVYLASDEAAWVTGGVFPVDGGYMAGKA